MLNRRYLTQKERAGYWSRVALEREATKLLADDRRRQRPSIPAQRSPEPAPAPPNGWMPLSNLKRAMRAREEH
jgi:hypothetical protein